MRLVLALAPLSVALLTTTQTQGADPLRFWNLTNATVSELYLAPAGTGTFGPNQAANDRDGEVDHNERLRLTGVAPGQYDVRLKLKGGKTCSVPGVTLRGEGRYAFSLEPADLKACE